MRMIAAAAILVIASTTAYAGPEVQPGADHGISRPESGTAEFQLVQDCGWFAILGCFPNRALANSWNSRIDEGYVINTSSMRYPNFRPGFYCVVNGPTSRARAQSIANGWRRYIPDAYVKNSC